jgi:hypothetical protein
MKNISKIHCLPFATFPSNDLELWKKIRIYSQLLLIAKGMIKENFVDNGKCRDGTKNIRDLERFDERDNKKKCLRVFIT